MEWIECSKQMPTGEPRLLLLNFETQGIVEYSVGYFNRLAGMWFLDGELHDEYEPPVTHWMPLPDPPVTK